LIVKIGADAVVVSQVGAGGGAFPAGSAGPAGPALTGLAVFTLTPTGHVASWSVTAARLFGIPAAVALGRDLREVLLTSAGQRELLHRALARTAAGLVWTGIVQVPTATGRHQVTLHCEPLTATEPLTAEPLTTEQAATEQPSPDQTTPHQAPPGSDPTTPAGTGVLVIARRALPESAENRLLPEAASLIGTTLDVYKTAREAADVAVPAFADSAAIL